jgi:hypothetical protein
VTATISSPSDGAVLGTATASTSLSEGDAAPMFSLSGPTMVRKGTNVTYTVTRSAPGETVANAETVNWTAEATSGTLTFLPTDTIKTFTIALPNGNGKSVAVSISSPSDGAQLGNSQVTTTTTNPAGIAGQPINLGLAALATDHTGPISATIAGVPLGWTISEGTDNGDGTWTVQTNNIAALTITSPATYTGALTLNVAASWINADGSIGHTTVIDNVEAYAAGSAIFALSGDDNLTGSNGHDMFVFSQPIGHDVIYGFDAPSDQIDLIGYANFTAFGEILAHTANDAAGNAVITLTDGQSITLNGVDATSLTASNFAFDQTPVTENAGHMVINDGAILPLSGIIDNTDTIELNSSGSGSELELIEHGITLQGHGRVILSDDSENVIAGTVSDVTLTNVDNGISGAGHLGDGVMTLVNQGTIFATGTYSLVIDTGANPVSNTGTLGSTGSGGLIVNSALTNTGLIWADGGNVVILRAVSGGGSALISGTAQLEFAGGSDTAASFDVAAAGILKLDQSSGFTGAISGFAPGDAIDLADLGFGPSSALSYSDGGAGIGGMLSVTDGAHSASLAMVGSYDQSSFQMAADAMGGTMVRLT